MKGNVPSFSTVTIAKLPNRGLSRKRAFIPSTGAPKNVTSNYYYNICTSYEGDDLITSKPETMGNTLLSTQRRRFSLSLGIKKLRKMKRRKINRMNKDLELFKLVKQRRLNNPNRLVDIRNINFLNDKCNLALMRLPVSPLVDLNGIVPFKTVPQMSSQVPFNPAPILHSIGYRFKPDRNGKYERFCDPYPMDKILQIIDARNMGAITRMSGKYKITGDGTRIPTPMDSELVEPGASVGKGYGFGLAKKPVPKNKPVPLSRFEPYAPDASHLVESLDELEDVKQEMRRYAEEINCKKPDEASTSSDDADTTDENEDLSYESEIREIMKQSAATQPYDSIEPANVEIPYMDDACTEGDIMRNPRYLGEYKNKYWYHPFYGNATMPGEEKEIIEEYNRENPDKPFVYEEYKVDLIYCHSNGTIVYLGENEDPYLNQADNFVMEGEDPREPRFILQAKVGFIKENELQLGQIMPNVNSEMREKYYDNLFFIPKSVRSDCMLHLPDGTPVR